MSEERELTMGAAVREALHHEMERDSTVVVMASSIFMRAWWASMGGTVCAIRRSVKQASSVRPLAQQQRDSGL